MKVITLLIASIVTEMYIFAWALKIVLWLMNQDSSRLNSLLKYGPSAIILFWIIFVIALCKPSTVSNESKKD